MNYRLGRLGRRPSHRTTAPHPWRPSGSGSHQNSRSGRRFVAAPRSGAPPRPGLVAELRRTHLTPSHRALISSKPVCRKKIE